MGEKKTLAKLLERFWWPGVTVMTRNHVQSCVHCQMHKVHPGPTRGLFHLVPAPRLPFDRVGIDHVGPFQMSRRGNRHLIVAVDYLTKWVEVKPFASTDAVSACRFVREDLVACHWVPKAVVKDNGTAFTAEVFAKMVEEFGISHTLVTPGYPQANGLVERLNKTLKSVLAAFINLRQDDRDDRVPMVVFAINAARQASTGFTPFELLQGRVPNLSFENRFPAHADAPEGPAQRALRIQRWREEARQLLLCGQ